MAILNVINLEPFGISRAFFISYLCLDAVVCSALKRFLARQIIRSQLNGQIVLLRWFARGYSGAQGPSEHETWAWLYKEVVHVPLLLCKSIVCSFAYLLDCVQLIESDIQLCILFDRTILDLPKSIEKLYFRFERFSANWIHHHSWSYAVGLSVCLPLRECNIPIFHQLQCQQKKLIVSRFKSSILLCILNWKWRRLQKSRV